MKFPEKCICFVYLFPDILLSQARAKMESQTGYNWSAEKSTRLANYVLRSMAIVFTFIAAIIVAVSRQSKLLRDDEGDISRYLIKTMGVSAFESLSLSLPPSPYSLKRSVNGLSPVNLNEH